MKLIPIPEERYYDYRLDLMFDCYKWDPQFVDNNTIAKYALVISQKEHEEISDFTRRLDYETRQAEELINNNMTLTAKLKLSKILQKEILKMNNYNSEKHVRLMRYDFHPTVEGKWAVSEVNSDVPGGFAEASLMPQKAINILGNYKYINFGEILIKAISDKLGQSGRIMLVHCTSYSDDRQVMQFLGDSLQEKGFEVIYAAADHLKFIEKKAYSILDGNEGYVDAIVRFTPVEWLIQMKTRNWHGYFSTETLSCNHPVAIYAQTKRFPFIWNELEENGVSMKMWRELLPNTLEVRDAKGLEGYIYKPVYGRVGENISIKEACTDSEYVKILKEVKKHPQKYIAQKKFESQKLQGINGEEFHVCLGSYAVEGEHAGYYARISPTPRIDSNAADIPVLIEV